MPDALPLNVLALYTVAAGYAAARIVEWAQKSNWKYVAWITEHSTKLKKTLAAALTSVLSAVVPVGYTWITTHAPPDWHGLGMIGWQVLGTFLVASGLWALLIHQSDSAEPEGDQPFSG